jgi:hypothetical protein
MRLESVDEEFSICRLESDQPVPDWATGKFVSITRTPDELSVVCPSVRVPRDVKHESGWRCFHVVGPFQFSEVGVIASLVEPLAKADVPVFVISTFDTDWLLIQEPFLERAIDVLEKSEHRVERGDV